jgi:hypothetical protein
MMTDLNIIKLLFKAKLSNSSNGQGRDKRYNTKIDGRMHSWDAKIADMVGKHLQTKEKTKMGEGE